MPVPKFCISIYLSLVYEWERRDFEQPLSVFCHAILPHSKISSPATYHKCIRALHAWGYVEYLPSYGNVLGSLVRFKTDLPPTLPQPWDKLSKKNSEGHRKDEKLNSIR